MRKIKNWICPICTLLLSAMISVHSLAAQLPAELEQEKEERESLEDHLNEAKSQVEYMQSEKDQIGAYVAELDIQMNELSQNLIELAQKMELKQADITSANIELDRMRATVEKQYSDMKLRIRYMYENGNQAYIELILGSENVADFVNNFYYVKEVSQYDRNMLNKYKKAKDDLLEKEAHLQLELKELEDMNSQVTAQQNDLQALTDEKTAELQRLESDLNDQALLAAAYEQEIAESEGNIARMEAQAAIMRQLMENGIGTEQYQLYNGDFFAWPLPASTRITSEFGNRLHPILNELKFHNGLDIGAPMGSPILAAYGGNVVEASYNSTMGNYVMIDHGGGLMTIYMHSSSLLVSAGKTVSKGETIALVGSTGRSTGPHLHFSVRLNGAYVNPNSYF